MPFIQTTDVNFYYELHGAGQPLILISGYSCDHSVWLPVIEQLSQHFQVLLFDNRGSGRTQDNDIPLTAELMAKDVVTLSDMLGLHKPHIVGHSMGGNIAQAIGALHPEKINRLALFMSSAKWRHATLLALKSSLNKRELNIDVEILINDILPWVYGESFLSNEQNIMNYKKKALAYPYAQTLVDQKRQYQLLQQFDGDKYITSIESPTLVGYGRQDLLALPANASYLAKQIKNSKLVELDCAHGLMLEVPELLVRTLVDFFQ